MWFKKLGLFLILALTVFSPISSVRAEDEPVIPSVHLTIRAGEVAYSEDVAAPEGSTVLSVLTTADESSPAFAVTDIQHYSFGDYLRCIEIEGVGEKCDDWQYVIDGDYPSTSIDLTPVGGAGSIYFYFSPKNQIALSSDTIDSNDTLTVTVESYDYEEGSWEFEEGAAVGVGVPDTSGSFNPPAEIMQGTTDSSGQTIFSNIPAGSYEVGIRDEYGYYFPSKSLTVTEAPAESSGGGGSSGGSKKSKGEVLGAEIVILRKFDTKKAFEFLLAQQKENGSFGADIYTDWAALALATGNYQENAIKLIKYFGESKLENPRLTDYERRAMALMALGLNPYNTNGVNYIEKIVSAFDGTQFGDANEDNDDIFALLVLLNAGHAPETEMLAKSTAFILGRQRENGSWDESVDMTGAAIVLLSQLPADSKTGDAISLAKNFLKEAQSNRSDGSWSASASSTAWALEGIKALGEKQDDWARSDGTPENFLASLQETDGGIKGENLNNRIWETAYAISALAPKTWSGTMQKFAKAEIAPANPVRITQTTSRPEVSAQPAAVLLATALAQSPDSEEAETSEENTETPEPEQNWFRRLLGNIFGFN